MPHGCQGVFRIDAEATKLIKHAKVLYHITGISLVFDYSRSPEWVH